MSDDLFSEALHSRRSPILGTGAATCCAPGQIIISEGHRLCVGLVVRNPAAHKSWVFHIHDEITPAMEGYLAEMKEAAKQGPNLALLVTCPSGQSSPLKDKNFFPDMGIMDYILYAKDYRATDKHRVRIEPDQWFKGLQATLQAKGQLTFADHVLFVPYWSYSMALDHDTGAIQVARDGEIVPHHRKKEFAEMQQVQASRERIYQICAIDRFSTNLDISSDGKIICHPPVNDKGENPDHSIFRSMESGNLSCDPVERQQQIANGSYFRSSDGPTDEQLAAYVREKQQQKPASSIHVDELEVDTLHGRKDGLNL